MKLLTLSTFPCDKPRHGGQHRVYNIVNHYQSLGHDVDSAGVMGSLNYEAHVNFSPYPSGDDFLKVIENPFLMDDWAIGKIFAQSDRHFSDLANRIAVIPDIIHIEHPWLFEFAIRYRQFVGRTQMKLIYGSANIEHRLKLSILSGYLPAAAAEEGARRVRDCEVFAIRNADAICCVSEHDHEWSKQFAKAKCVLAPNGVGRRELTADGLKEANAITGHQKFALYCASAHPPNVTGFFDLFAAGLGSLAPDQLLVIAGSVGNSISTHPLAERIPGIKSRVRVAGEVSESALQGLLETAHAIVLPITQGEGTNLKTAEAIWAKRHVVATSKAMRGFEQFEGSAGISVRDDPHEFLQALQNAMGADPLVVPQSELKARAAVLWENTLSSLSDLVPAQKNETTRR
jgi:hypothetical protein